MKRKQAIEIIDKVLGEGVPIISSTGLMSRQLFDMNDTVNHFYMTGSMGLAGAIGFGLALNSKQKIVVLEGDASLLMNLGVMTTICRYKPENLIHIVLDNQAYASCSEEKSASSVIALEKLAKVAGYEEIVKVSTIKKLENTLEMVLGEKGPIFVLVEIDLGGRRDLPRPIDLPGIAKRFKKYIEKNE